MEPKKSTLIKMPNFKFESFACRGGVVKLIHNQSMCLFVLLAIMVSFFIPALAYSQDKLVVQDLLANKTFSVAEDGTVFTLGKIGVGTPFNPNYGINIMTGPAHERIRIQGSASSGFYLIYPAPNNGDGATVRADDTGLAFFATNSAPPQLKITRSSYMGIGTASPTHLLHLSGGAYSDGATWVDASSRELKENIKEVSVEEAVAALGKLEPVQYNYKAKKEEQHVGFIAEDVPDMVATNGRKGLSAMDITAVLTKVVQEQQKTIADLQKRLSGVEISMQFKKDKDLTVSQLVQE